MNDNGMPKEAKNVWIYPSPVRYLLLQYPVIKHIGFLEIRNIAYSK